MAAERRVEPWPIAIASMLAAMIGTSVAFYVVAARHVDAEVVEDAYAAGLRYNAELAAEQRAEAQGYRVTLDAAPAPQGVRVTAQVEDASGRPLAAQAARVRRERPTQGGFDTDLPLVRSGDAWVAEVPLPLPGRWRLEAEFVVDGAPVRQRIDVRREP